MAKYRGTNHYIGAWHYVLLDILYAIPVIGWIVLVVHCFNKEKENRMHHARSKFAHLLTALVALVIAGTVIYFTAGRQYFDHREEIDRAWNRFQERYDQINRSFNDEVKLILESGK